MTISFNCTAEEVKTIAGIAARAEQMAKDHGAIYERMTAVMDILATHANGCPLQLSELLAASDGDFAHDVFGIRTNIDRKTGQLTGCFLPRYAKAFQ